MPDEGGVNADTPQALYQREEGGGAFYHQRYIIIINKFEGAGDA